jgi:[acyl-carrier-protein] S-malonyltransferase
MKVAYLFPGQGSQYIGMGKDFFDRFESAKEIFAKANRALGFALSDLMFQGEEEELKKTLHSQLAIFVMSLAIVTVVEEKFPHLHPMVCAGLSLGEYSALCASKRLSLEQALFLIKQRALLMNAACEQTSGGMAAVLGLQGEEVDAVICAIGSSESVWVANYNCPGQVVISGTLQGIEKASLRLKEKGAKRILPLQVQGAFHSPLMLEAQRGLEPLIHGTPFHPSLVDLVMNASGDFISSSEELKSLLVQQVTNSVRWEMGIRKMSERGIDLFIEMGSGKTLQGMNRKIGVEAKTISIEKLEDLLELQTMMGG